MAQLVPAQLQVPLSSVNTQASVSGHLSSVRQASSEARQAKKTLVPQPSSYDETPHSPLAQSAPVVHRALAQ